MESSGIAKRKLRVRQYGRKRRQFKGRKERLRAKNAELVNQVQSALVEKQELLEEKTELTRENSLLKKKCWMFSRNTTATNSCITRPSGTITTHPSYSIVGIRKIARADVHVNKHCIGRGVFGKCYVGRLAHIEVCIKAFRKGYEKAFPAEAHILFQCNHENLPWIYGIIAEERVPRAIVMSFHGKDGSSTSLHHALSIQAGSKASLSPDQGKAIIIGLLSAIKYLHENNILHNDIKSDNVVVEYALSTAKGVLVDLGKACYSSDGKKYTLTQEEKKKYSENHPQIAPDLRNGHCPQSFASDIYSVGRVLGEVNRLILKSPGVNSYSNMCKDYLCSKRPATNDVYTFFYNLFTPPIVPVL